MSLTPAASGNSRRTGQPLGAVLGAVMAADGSVDLVRLAEMVADLLTDAAGDRCGAVAVHPDNGVLLDTTWNPQTPVCVVSGTCAGRSRWRGGPALWERIDSLNSGPTAPGSERHPQRCDGDLFFGDDGTVGSPASYLFVGAAGSVVMALAVTGTNDSGDEVLVEVGAALQPLVQLWVELGSLRRRLNGLDGENKALARLNRLQGRFVALASHELKAPLTSITAYTDVLASQLSGDDHPHADEFLGVIRTESDRLLRMVHRILDFTRLEFGGNLLTLEPMDMTPLVRDVVQALGPHIAAKDLTVEVQAPDRLPRAVVDTDLIRQVIMNLVDNAVKYTPAGGRITVGLQETESSLAVSVMDDGLGIPPADLRRIFREFYRAEAGPADGTGLGLTISRHIVHLHGGHIQVTRRPEGGSVFRFTVPKETGAMASVAEVLGKPVAADKAQRLIEMILYFVADMTGSRTVALLLRDGQGGLVPVGAIGLEAKTPQPRPVIENASWTRFLETGKATTDPGRIVRDLPWCPRQEQAPRSRMFAPLGSGDKSLGCVIMGRRRGVETYGAADLEQLDVLTDVARAALSGLGGDIDRTCEAVKMLLLIRRRGIPTATAEALDLVRKLAGRLGLRSRETRGLLYAATLHDAGMARVEDEIVLGEADLSYDERDEVNRHVERGLDLMGPLIPDQATRRIILHHHERFDGSGYPVGLEGTEIPLGSRVLAVVDAWCSLTTARPFRSGLTPEAALAELRKFAGTQFDPSIVTEFAGLLHDEKIVNETSPTQVLSGPDLEETT